MVLTTSLKEEQWQAASNLAIALVNSQDEINPKKQTITTELNRIIAYLRACQSQGKTPQLSNYLTALIKNGESIGHGKENTKYYEAIKEAGDKHLKDYLNGEEILTILGWSCRLMRYYQNGGPVGEVREQVSARQEKAKVIRQSQSFSVGQIVDAKVTKKTKEKQVVSYKIEGQGTLPEYRCPVFKKLQLEQVVKVEITRMKGKKVKNVKYAGPA